MSRGHPDYNVGDITSFSIDNPNSDVIAERSGFARLDNRGRVLWFDDFRQGLFRWSPQSNGTGDDPIHIHSNELSIGYHGCIRLDCVGNNGISVMDTTLVLPASKKIGMELGLRLIDNFGDVEIRLSHNYSGTNAREAIFYIVSGTGEIKIYDNLVFTSIYTPPLLAQLLNSWITIKFAIDAENNTWLRCMLGNQQIELSQYALRNGTASVEGFTEVLIRNTGTSAILKEEWYCGYVVISGDEP